MNKSGSLEEITVRKVLFLTKTINFKTHYSKIECIHLVEQPIPDEAWKTLPFTRFPPTSNITKDEIHENSGKITVQIPLHSFFIEIAISDFADGSNVYINIRYANKVLIIFVFSLPFLYMVIQISRGLTLNRLQYLPHYEGFVFLVSIIAIAWFWGLGLFSLWWTSTIRHFLITFYVDLLKNKPGKYD